MAEQRKVIEFELAEEFELPEETFDKLEAIATAESNWQAVRAAKLSVVDLVVRLPMLVAELAWRRVRRALRGNRP
jgi:hypothetical protein